MAIDTPLQDRTADQPELAQWQRLALALKATDDPIIRELASQHMLYICEIRRYIREIARELVSLQLSEKAKIDQLDHLLRIW